MKRQEVSVDVPLMITTAVVYLGLAALGWILFRLIQACFWLPNYLKTCEKEKSQIEESHESLEVLLGNESDEDKKNV